MNGSQIVSDLQFLDLEDLLALHGPHMDLQSEALMQRRIYRGSGLGRLYPPLHQYVLVLFDGERPLHCAVVDKLVFFFQALSPHLAPHLLCVKLIFSDDEKHLG